MPSARRPLRSLVLAITTTLGLSEPYPPQPRAHRTPDPDHVGLTEARRAGESSAKAILRDRHTVRRQF
jgi:hypothetical protein